ncbi:MAG: Tyrosine-protein kinase ptk [Pseudomonadota bacterium]|jgi:uncharacterized protein involved in exopolysaccharide biosynthesis
MTQLQDPMHSSVESEEDAINLLDLLTTVVENLKLLVFGSLGAGVVALGISFLITPTFTAKTSMIPPSLANSITNSALRAELGGLAGLGGGGGLAGLAGGLKNPGDQFVAYMESNILRDELITKYKLQERYDQKYLENTRKELKKKVKLTSDKKTGLITIEVDDHDPKFAAALANDYVDSLSRMIGRMTLAEAKARRELLEQQITEATQKSYQSPMVREGVIQSLIREYESARLDEKRDHPFVVQVDPAQVPELKSKPKKALIAIVTTFAVFFLLLIFVFVRQALQKAKEDPETRDKLAGLNKLFRQQWKSSKS